MAEARRVVIRPPPGVRFINWASPDSGHADLYLEYEGGTEKQVIDWFYTWIETYMVPNMDFQKQLAQKQQEVKLKQAAETAKEIVKEAEQAALPFTTTTKE